MIQVVAIVAMAVRIAMECYMKFSVFALAALLEMRFVASVAVPVVVVGTGAIDGRGVFLHVHIFCVVFPCCFAKVTFWALISMQFRKF